MFYQIIVNVLKFVREMITIHVDYTRIAKNKYRQIRIFRLIKMENKAVIYLIPGNRNILPIMKYNIFK